MLPQGRIAYRTGNAPNLGGRMAERRQAAAESGELGGRADQAQARESMPEERMAELEVEFVRAGDHEVVGFPGRVADEGRGLGGREERHARRHGPWEAVEAEVDPGGRSTGPG